jgi:hypothetical protein
LVLALELNYMQIYFHLHQHLLFLNSNQIELVAI